MLALAMRFPTLGARYQELLALLAGLLTFLCVPFKITSYGYLPPDDVLRHAAYAVDTRTWQDIVIGRPGAVFDQSPGWHAFLRAVHHLTNLDQGSLAVLSIVLLLTLFFLCGLPWVRRWEAWALALLALYLMDPELLHRFTLGRPFILPSLFSVVLLGSARDPGGSRPLSLLHGGWILGAAVCTWVHGAWYLMFLPPLAFLLAGRIRDAVTPGRHSVNNPRDDFSRTHHARPILSTL